MAASAADQEKEFLLLTEAHVQFCWFPLTFVPPELKVNQMCELGDNNQHLTREIK